MSEIKVLIIDDEEFCVQALIEDISWKKMWNHICGRGLFCSAG